VDVHLCVYEYVCDTRGVNVARCVDVTRKVCTQRVCVCLFEYVCGTRGVMCVDVMCVDMTRKVCTQRVCVCLSVFQFARVCVFVCAED